MAAAFEACQEVMGGPGGGGGPAIGVGPAERTEAD
jgi:hypothetical protein